MGIDVNAVGVEVVEVYDSNTDVSYGVASLWGDAWRLDDESFPHTHPDVDAIFRHVTSLTAFIEEETRDTDEEEQSDLEEDEDTYTVLSIDVKDVPNSTDMCS